MKLHIVKYPDPVLRKAARPITDRELKAGSIDGLSIEELAKSMLEEMHASKGVGLAAPQVGLAYRLFVVDVTEDHSESYVVINPEILEATGSATMEEGCLSFPGLRGNVKRHAKVVLSANDGLGKRVELCATGLLARAFEHEYDHLEGTLFIDRLSSAKRLFMRRDLRQLEEEYKDRLERAART